MKDRGPSDRRRDFVVVRRDMLVLTTTWGHRWHGEPPPNGSSEENLQELTKSKTSKAVINRLT